MQEDHEGERHSSLASIGARADTAPVQLYMDCMKQESYGPGACRELSKAYLQCRMDTCAGRRRALPSRTWLSAHALDCYTPRRRPLTRELFT